MGMEKNVNYVKGSSKKKKKEDKQTVHVNRFYYSLENNVEVYFLSSISRNLLGKKVK